MGSEALYLNKGNCSAYIIYDFSFHFADITYIISRLSVDIHFMFGFDQAGIHLLAGWVKDCTALLCTGVASAQALCRNTWNETLETFSQLKKR